VSYQNPAVLNSLTELSKEAQLIGLIKKFPELNETITTSGEIYSKLLEGGYTTSYRVEALTIAKDGIIFGKIMAAAADRFPEILIPQGRSNGSTMRYKIVFPAAGP
jgi:hypothetical protein